MRKDIFKTLFSRMLATYLTVTLCLLLIMGVTAVGMFRNQYMQETEQSLRREADKINLILVEKYVYPEKQRVAMEELSTIARKYDALIQVIDSDGRIMAFYDDVESESRWGRLKDVPVLSESQRIVYFPGLTVLLEPNYAVTRETDRTKDLAYLSRVSTALTERGMISDNIFDGIADFPVRSFVRVVINNNQPDGIILLHFDMSQVNASINSVYLDILLTALIAVVAAILSVYYLTTRITKPIIDMNNTVKRYTKGEFNLRIQLDGADEVAQLAKSFNAMADEVSDLEQSRRSFVANVSHELRSPLTSMRGFLEAMQDGTIAPEDQGKYLEIVIGETRRMTSMVNDLLDLARIESGKSVLKLEVFDLNELLLRTLLTFETRIDQKNISVSTDGLQTPCYVEADCAQITQVLRNLIDNAIKFSPDNGKLVVGSKQHKKEVSVFVQDFGSGISKEDLPHVFERFYKAEKAHTPSVQSGTGLGLSIVKRIIDQHGQNISVESSLAEGTRFTFTLKRAESPRVRRNNTDKSDGGSNP